MFCNGCYGRMGADTEQTSSQAEHAESQILHVGDFDRSAVEEPDWGQPFSVMDAAQAVGWQFYVRAEHLLRGTFPIPAEMAHRSPKALNMALVPSDKLALAPGAKRVPILDYQPGAKLESHGDRLFLEGVNWHPFVLPGTRVTVRWDRRARTRLHFSYTRLRRPLVVAGTMVRYAYDPRIMTRDLAALDVPADRTEELVLITLRELGYLDERGRALLPQQELIRNASRGAQPKFAPTNQIREAIQRLRSNRLLTLEWGSLSVDGVLHFPSRVGERPVQLLCYAPTVRDTDGEEHQAAGGRRAEGVGAHRVAGHLMRIGHLGKEASAEAKAAYRHDHQAAGLAGPHELPRGYTYVREHERGV
ncbi:hypothetical protein [Streptomyces sp. NPDC054756]